jgi:hypothetical protein
MPRLSRWFIRSSLVYLAVGFTFGGLMLFDKGVPFAPALWDLLPAHMDFLLLGWTVQLAIGVAFWILPRFGSERGRIEAAWLAFILLNAGLLLTGPGSLPGAPAIAVPVGRAAEVGAAVALLVHSWPRVKPSGA